MNKGPIFLRCCLIALVVGIVPACQLHLRGQHKISDTFAGFSITSSDTNKLTANKLRSIFQGSGAGQIHLAPAKLQRQLLSVFANGQIAEYALLYEQAFTVHFTNLPPQHSQVRLERDFQENPQRSLAKSRETEIILAELRELAAQQIIAQLPSLYAQAQQTQLTDK